MLVILAYYYLGKLQGELGYNYEVSFDNYLIALNLWLTQYKIEDFVRGEKQIDFDRKNLGVSLREAFEETEAYFRNFGEKLKGFSARFNLCKARFYLFLGEYSQALEFFSKVEQEYHPEVNFAKKKVYFLMAYCNLKLNKRLEAIDNLEKGCKCDELDSQFNKDDSEDKLDYIRNLLNIAHIYLSLNKFSSAAEYYERAKKMCNKKLQSSKFDIYCFLGYCYFKLHRIPDAIAAFKEGKQTGYYGYLAEAKPKLHQGDQTKLSQVQLKKAKLREEEEERHGLLRLFF